MAKKRTKSGKSVGLKQVPSKDYSVKWDAGQNTCVFRHKSGKGGELGCGVSDIVSVFSGGGRIFVLSVNYPARYACIETFKDAAGIDELLFAEPPDISKMFGHEFASHSPKQIAERLTKELG